MRKLILIFFICTLTGSYVNVSHAALDWRGLQNEVLNLNEELASEESTAESRHYLARASLAGFLPQVSLFGDATRKKESNPNLFFNTGTNLYSIKYNREKATYHSYGITSSLNLFNGLSTLGNLYKASSQEKAARSSLKLKKIDLRFSLAKAYTEWIIAKKSEKMSQSIVKRQRYNRELIKIKYNNGLEAKWALDLADSAVELAEQRLSYDLALLDSSYDNISQLVKGRPELEEDSVFSSMTEINVSHFDADKHPQVQFYESQIREYESEKMISRSGYMPTLDLNHSWGKSRKKGEEFTADNSISLNLTWNLFNGFYTTNVALSAGATYRSAVSSKRVTREKLELELIQAQREYKLALSFHRLKSNELRATMSRAEILSNQYRSGLRSYADWESSQNNLTTVERQVIDSEKDALMARSNLEKILGLGLGDL